MYPLEAFTLFANDVRTLANANAGFMVLAFLAGFLPGINQRWLERLAGFCILAVCILVPIAGIYVTITSTVEESRTVREILALIAVFGLPWVVGAYIGSNVESSEKRKKKA